jgi:hypothetical protein
VTMNRNLIRIRCRTPIPPLNLSPSRPIRWNRRGSKQRLQNSVLNERTSRIQPDRLREASVGGLELDMCNRICDSIASARRISRTKCQAFVYGLFPDNRLAS